MRVSVGWLPLLIGALCLLALTMRLDWAAVGGALGAARWSLLVLGAALTLASVGLRTVRWRLLLGGQAPAWGTILGTYAMGVAAGLALPASGELARAWLLARRGGPRTSFVLASVAVEKLLDVGTTLVLFVVALALASASLPGAVGAGAGALVVAILVASAAAVWLAPHLDRLPRWLPAPPRRAAESLALALAERAARFRAGLRTVLQLGWAARLAVGALTLLVWGAAIAATLCALAAFALPADPRLAAVLYGALLLGLSVPSAPAAVGTWELVCVAVLDAWGLPLAASGAFALGFHAMAYVPPLALGALAWMLSGGRLAAAAAGAPRADVP